VASESVKRLRAGDRIHVGSLVLVPVERVSIHAGWIAGTLEAVATQEPLGVVCRTPGGLRGFDVDGDEMPIDDLLATIDGLREALA